MEKVGELDFYSAEASIDPHPLLAKVREAGPAVWHDVYQAWMVGRYRDIQDVCRDDVNFTARDGIVAHNFGENAMLAQDGAVHRKIRSAWNAPFLRTTLTRLQPTVEEVARQLIAPIAARLAAGDAIDIAPANRGLPVEIVAILLGIPEEHRPGFARWSDEITHMTGFALPPDHPVELRRIEAQREVANLMRAEIAKRRTHMQDDLIGNLVESGIGDQLGDEALVDNCRLLLVAGNETTSNWIGNAIAVLRRHPDQLAAVRADRGLLAGALEEVLRYEGVAHLGFRRARTEAAQVGGVKIPAGDQLWLIYGSGNRDPRRFPDADRFDIRREIGDHIGFGHSFHTCLGLNLARIEGAAYMNAFLDAVPGYDIVEIDYGISFPLRGPSKLVLRAA